MIIAKSNASDSYHHFEAKSQQTSFVTKGKTRGPIPNQPEFAHKMDTCGLGYKVIIMMIMMKMKSKKDSDEKDELKKNPGHSLRSGQADGEHGSRVRR